IASSGRATTRKLRANVLLPVRRVPASTTTHLLVGWQRVICLRGEVGRIHLRHSGVGKLGRDALWSTPAYLLLAMLCKVLLVRLILTGRSFLPALLGGREHSHRPWPFATMQRTMCVLSAARTSERCCTRLDNDALARLLRPSVRMSLAQDRAIVRFW